MSAKVRRPTLWPWPLPLAHRTSAQVAANVRLPPILWKNNVLLAQKVVF